MGREARGWGNAATCLGPLTDLRPRQLPSPTPADWEKLKASFQENTYYPADLVFGGQTLHNVGIRSRGGGSRNARKPGLRVDIDRYSDAQTFLGLRSFVLDNLTQDPSAVRETVTMKLFARIGIPAPREAHVRLYVNDTYVGLYAAVESIDKQFLARIYTARMARMCKTTGTTRFRLPRPVEVHLSGPRSRSVQSADRAGDARKQERCGVIRTDRGAGQARQRAASRGLSRSPQRPARSPCIHALCRGQNFLGENDGFLGYVGMNNFYLYRLENSNRHVFIAWDEDYAFGGPEFPITLRHDENVLMSRAMQVGELRDHYYSVLAEAAAAADEPTGPDGMGWLEFEVRRQLDLITDALREDPSKPYSFDEHERERAALIIFSRDRTRSVHSQLQASPARLRP